MKTPRVRSALLVATVLVAAIAPPLAATSIAGADPVGIDAHGSVEQVYATGLPPDNHLALLDDGGDTVATTQVNALGAALFRNVDPGADYTVSDVDAGTTSAPLTVHPDDPAPWNPDIYDQTITSDGYQYLTTRDGTELALSVRPPLAGGPGPYPTLIEYSGYGYADPSGPQSGLALLANAMGFAVVDVNMRGTGCSGGAFDYFEMLQNLDAYDVIETIANQPWVAHNQVGMFGISYGGISQLFAAQLDPPSLAAIAPLSVIDATPTTLYPGGILNSGFALEWAQGRVDDAKPATATTGQKWAYKRIQEGDTACEANQALHLDAVDLIAKIKNNEHYVPEIADPLDPVSFVHKIRTPVYLACQFQDEQTGGHCPELARHFTGTDDKWFSFTNGAHIDALDPENLNQIFDFLELFVAERPPGPDSGLMKLAAPIIYQSAMGVSDDIKYTLPDDPIQHETTYDGALAAFRRLPTVQVRFDNGAGSDPKG
ncbi:MAG TPA: CocE/NonD family hydrolase, partial [Acidimicrobiales bacterium]|nr:CocE/NonD family hydrolase [Acidimicrobiales bacterium]